VKGVSLGERLVAEDEGETCDKGFASHRPIELRSICARLALDYKMDTDIPGSESLIRLTASEPLWPSVMPFFVGSGMAVNARPREGSTRCDILRILWYFHLCLYVWLAE
jgi:hypothetical protein